MKGVAAREPKAIAPGAVDRVRPAERDDVVGQAVLFTVVGALATAANAVLYMLLRGIFPVGASNFCSLLITTAASSAAHRHFAFAARDEHRGRMHLQTLAVFAFYCVSNNIALGLLGLTVEDPSSVAEAAAVAALSVIGGTTRFVVMRLWVFSRSARHRASWE
ncbi:Putative flippase GtrA (transmembrane translocase of bactoprenol-linked glucose) [Saccharopolyspora shandongensis]|uniref:Putative flippase GtrA (Transmembrane translocase of bactoprenol-linked glucose) n=1 Tax=Saccharopolyspora shandongensis TaxID=418495 RepID=A0A1H2XWG2_9PSEU|nr:GtrA family protein [Saccharopolyspora shandongensis]SDW97206.1 Putative flippase GtrA (transmembrane translocase of bactoprenol-linked glucose) [Saccharopolyspora shandongensis]